MFVTTLDDNMKGTGLFLHRCDAPASLVSSFLLILFAGNHVSLSYVERWGVAICVGRVLKQN